MTPTEAAVLTAARALRTAQEAEVQARKEYKQTQRAPGKPAPKVHTLHVALLSAEDAAADARAALLRAVRALPEPEVQP